MNTTPSRKQSKAKANGGWPRKVQPGRTPVTVYRRKTPSGNFAFMVSNYVDGGRRRFDSYSIEKDALEAAEQLAKRLDSQDYVAANLTRDQAIEYASSAKSLEPFNVTVRDATSVVAQCLKEVGDLANVHAAIKFFKARHKQVTKKSIAVAVTEFLAIKKTRGASERYLSDLRGRLERFSEDCQKNLCDITTTDVQGWLDGQKFQPQNYKNFRTVLFTFFEHAVARGYAGDNPVDGTEQVKVRGGEVAIFTPSEIARLLAASSPAFLPCLCLGAFAGLRSAEIERLEWSDIHLAEKFIVVSAAKAKTAGRRIVPIHDNLGAWLQTYSEKRGKVWSSEHDNFYDQQQTTAAATAVQADPDNGVKALPAIQWKANGLRHSYASYRFAQIGDAGRVAGELGNSAGVVHKHYRELVKPTDAVKWFNVKPESPANVVPMRGELVS